MFGFRFGPASTQTKWTVRRPFCQGRRLSWTLQRLAMFSARDQVLRLSGVNSMLVVRVSSFFLFFFLFSFFFYTFDKNSIFLCLSVSLPPPPSLSVSLCLFVCLSLSYYKKDNSKQTNNPVPNKPYGFCGREAPCLLILNKQKE